MKLHYKKTKDYWCNSTESLKYYPSTQIATSYSHWCFLKRIEGLLVLNKYSYSVTTSRHISTISYFLKTEFNLVPDLVIDYYKSLNSKEDLIEYYEKLKTKTIHTKTKKELLDINQELLNLEEVLSFCIS